MNGSPGSLVALESEPEIQFVAEGQEGEMIVRLAKASLSGCSGKIGVGGKTGVGEKIGRPGRCAIAERPAQQMATATQSFKFSFI